WFVTAEKGDDLSYRVLDQRKWHLSDVAQGGRNPVESYDLFLYAERGVYRPGDIIRMTGIMRDPQGNVPPVFPLEIHAWQPDGRKVRSWSISPDEGLFHAEFPTHPDGQTGSYRFAVGLPGSDSYFGESTTLVEAFEPVRIEAKATPAKPMFGPDDDHLVNLSARYLFGEPAARMPYELKGAYYRVPFKSKSFPRYRFEILDGVSVKPSSRCVDATDDEGHAVITMDDSRIRHLPGFWEGRFHVTVTTPGGRSVSDRCTFRADPVGYHVGLAFPEDFPPPPGESFDVGLVMVDGEDKAVALTETEVILERIERNWILQQVDGSRVWRVQTTYTTMAENALANEGEAKLERSLSLTCPTAGSYRLTARNLHTGAKAQASFYVSSYGDQTDPALASPHRVTLKLDKEKHLPGELARVRVVAPFAGRLLLTLETDRPIVLRSMLMDKAETDVEIRIPDTVRGSAFLSATVIRPLDFDSPDWKPHRAYGMTRLPVDHSIQFLEPVIEAPSKVEPNTEVTLRVKTPMESLDAQSARVHLWAVDEGILLVTDHETPDPGKHFFAHRRNLVDSGDLYLELLPDHKRPVSMDRTGAGGKRAPAALIKPQPREPIVLWRTFAKAGPDGTFETTFRVPDFSGELRFMAVVVAGDSYGSTDHALTVASPLLVEPSWPRFVAPGDHFRVPVKVFNSTDTACSPKLTFTLDGPVVAKWEKGAQMHLAPGKAKTLWLSAEATGLGHVQALVRAETRELKVEANAKFFSRPASVLHVERRSVQLKAGEQITIERPEAIIGETVTTVTVSSLPSLDLRPAVDRLMTFPYGCVEQTSSRIAPMLFAANLFDGGKAEYLRRLVDVGIDRIASMQTSSGGLDYWPGNRDPYMWGTCYASLIIAEATAAGHAATRVDQKALAAYLARSLKEENPGLNEQALLCRVLAVFKQPELARQSFLLSRLDQLDLAGRAHLAAAWLESGRRDQAALALPDGTLQLKPAIRSTGRRLTSPVAQEAILLSVLLSLDEDHPWIPELVDRLNLSRKTGNWRSTLDDGLAVAALSRYQAGRNLERGTFTGALSVGNEKEIEFTSEQSTDFVFKGKEPIRLTSEGSGNVYLSIKSEGLALLDHSNEQDRGIVVRRRWLDADGRVIRDWTPNGKDKNLPPLSLRLGQLIRVEVRLSTRGRGMVHNIAVVDALPGGMEVENPRLATSFVDNDGSPVIPNEIDFRDDRVVLFASASGQPDTYAYSLRAITQGEFSIPAVQATCMYDSSLNSLHGAGKLRITPIQ
ncbi:MAG: MG2 domain-containing protein, partial [Opitutales bacterium]